MSEAFFNFNLCCPKCNHIRTMADGYETDDWVEVFVFSGYSPKNTGRTPYHDYECPNCKQTTPYDELYEKQCIELESLDKLKNYLTRMLPYVLERKGICDHGWDPDILTAIRRYATNYPHDKELEQLRELYFFAYYNPKKLVKFEPGFGIKRTEPNMILRKDLLHKTYLPDSLQEIGDKTFCDCTKITDIFIPKTVWRIGKEAFKNCYSLEKIHTSDNLEIIEAEAFSNCRKLKQVFIPNSCKSIEKNAFLGCPDITIKGMAGSFAEKYSIENDIPFIVTE